MRQGKFSIVVDSNEYSGGRAWTFPGYTTHVSTLIKAGCDYSIRGQVGIIGVERKSFSDYVRCLGGDWNRFCRQMAKLQKNRFHCIIVEGNLDDKIPHYSRMTQSAVTRQTARVTSYGIPVLFASTAYKASRLCVDYMTEALKRIREG